MKQFLVLPAVAALPLLIGACANTGANYSPVVDGPKSSGYQADLNACQALARHQFRGEPAGAAFLGGGIGALAGLADEDLSDTEGAIGGALVGAAAGGVAGAVSTAEKRKAIVIACMRGRGHRVVG